MNEKNCKWAASFHTRENCDACHDLEYCPCCGSDNVMKVVSYVPGKDKWIRCVKCGISTGMFDTFTKAIKVWNNRPNKSK